MTPEEQAELDQSTASLVDFFCPMWRRMYKALLIEGFNECESLKLVQAYILSQCPSGIRGADG